MIKMDRVEKRVKVIGQTKPPEIPANITPSPTMRVHFSDGEVVQMNRAERRRNHLYGDRLKVRKSRPAPPRIFHSLDEMRDSERNEGLRIARR